MKKLLFLNFLLFWSPFLWAKDLTAKEALKIMNETQRAQRPHLLRQSQQEKFLKACGDQSFKSDENLFYQYCEAFISSDLCKDVSPEKRMNCNEDLKASITHAPENVWNCMKGVGLGIKDIIVVLGKMLKGIFTFITSPIESTKKGAKIVGAGLNQFQNYASTEYARELQIINKENPPPDSKRNKTIAMKAVTGVIFGNLIDNVFNFLGEKNTAFACYNDENKWKRSCQLITNIVSIFAGGIIAAKGVQLAAKGISASAVSAARWLMPSKKGVDLTPPANAAKNAASSTPQGTASKAGSASTTEAASAAETASTVRTASQTGAKTTTANQAAAPKEIKPLKGGVREWYDNFKLSRQPLNVQAPIFLKKYKPDFIIFRETKMKYEYALRLKDDFRTSDVPYISSKGKYVLGNHSLSYSDVENYLKSIEKTYKKQRKALSNKLSGVDLRDVDYIAGTLPKMTRYSKEITRHQIYINRIKNFKAARNAAEEAEEAAEQAANRAQRATYRANEAVKQANLSPLAQAEAQLARIKAQLAQRESTLAQKRANLARAKAKLKGQKLIRAEARLTKEITTNPSFPKDVTKNLNKTSEIKTAQAEIRAAQTEVRAAQTEVNAAKAEVKRYEDVPIIKRERRIQDEKRRRKEVEKNRQQES